MKPLDVEANVWIIDWAMYKSKLESTKKKSEKLTINMHIVSRKINKFKKHNH
jgi:hypothetical protein